MRPAPRSVATAPAHAAQGDGSPSNNTVVAAGEPLVLIAAGGTGGHLFPAEALARQLTARGRNAALVTDGRGAGFGAMLPGVPTFRIRAASPSGNLFRKIRGAVDLFAGMIQSRRLIRRQRPSVVIGFGGYPSVPPLLAAAAAGIPVVLHEQNAILGRANRMLATRSRAIATAHATVGGLPASVSVTLTGNPVRPQIAAKSGAPYEPPHHDGPLRVLVIGGSQGARVFSKVLPPAIHHLEPALRQRLQITQQCRPEDLEEVTQAYAGMQVSATLRNFFDDVPDRLAAAHLVVCRAGASTVAELCAVGRPAILVPYPHAADDHQTANARALEAAGGGWLLPEPEFTPRGLAARLQALLSDPAQLSSRAANARAAAIDDAAERLADLCETFLPAAAD